MIEATLKLDSLGQNLQYTDSKAQIRQIYNLILMKPGTDLLNPNKGCDARSYYYAIKDDGIIQELQEKITDQISKYTPYVTRGVICKASLNRSNKWILHIMIMLVNGQTAVVSTDADVSTLNLITK